MERVGIFIDYENFRNAKVRHNSVFIPANFLVSLKQVVKDSVDECNISVARVYADWTRESYNPMEFFQLGFSPRLVLCKHMGNGSIRDNTDLVMSLDILEILHTRQDLSMIVLCSGDADFTDISMRIRESGRRLLVIGPQGQSSRLLAGFADKYKEIG